MGGCGWTLDRCDVLVDVGGYRVGVGRLWIDVRYWVDVGGYWVGVGGH